MLPTPGPLELVIILVIALLILGPGRLPDVGSALGKSIREFRKASSDLGDSVKVDTSPLPSTPQDAPSAAPSAAIAPPAVSTTTAEPAVGSTTSSSPTAAPRSSEPTPGTN